MSRRIRSRIVGAALPLVTALVQLGAQASRSVPPRVTISTGTLEGVLDSATGVMVFRGIPYAAPPVGGLRWRAPRPPASWSGVRRADRLGHNCMQAQIYGDIDPFAAGVSEDCLYLNVWTAGTTGPRRPVLVWIHGGGYRAGFGGETRHDGGPLAKKGAVVVTLNYRLGALGFLAHPALSAESPHAASGDYGLLDQIAALEWVRRNIGRFGGDPTRVTIFGESAGGMSVGALVASPLARGLFRRAILESGTGLGVEPRDSAVARGIRFAAAMGVPNGRDAAARLRALRADTLAGAAGTPSAMPFQPAVDGWLLPHAVDSAFARGAFTVVPVIVGSNADEPDEVFGAPARALARFVTARGAPAYVYQFTRAGEDSASRRRGAYHSAEITFVFGRPHPLQPSAGRAPYDSTLADAMSDYWVAFASGGDPNGPPSAGKWPRWPVYDATTDAYLELGPTIVAGSLLRRARYDSLDDLARAHGAVRPASPRTGGGGGQANRLTAAERAAGWQLLFDGRSFAGWRGLGYRGVPREHWTIEHGAIRKIPSGKVPVQADGQPSEGGDLMTEATYRDFELRWDWKVTPGANSGVKYNVSEELSSAMAPAHAAKGFEYQMLDDDRHEDGKLPTHRAGALYDLVAPNADKHLNAVGEWNHSMIRLRGNHGEHWLNGRKIVEYELGSPAMTAALAASKYASIPWFAERRAGHIVLQDHGDEVYFRNLELRELPPAPRP